jgi:hypothetical protein
MWPVRERRYFRTAVHKAGEPIAGFLVIGYIVSKTALNTCTLDHLLRIDQ